MTTVQGIDPRTSAPVGPPVPTTSAEELAAICAAAAVAAPLVDAVPYAARADALRAVAAALRDAQADIVALADAETALGVPRLTSELERTWLQLEMFADVVVEGSVFEAVIDLPDAGARPAPRPDLRRILVGSGPVAVFS